MKKILLSVLALSLLTFGADASAQHKNCDGKKGMMQHHDGERGFGCGMFFGDPEVLKEKLGLNAEQVEKINKINLDFKKEFLKIKEKLAPKRIKLRAMLLEDNVNLNDVRSLLKEISELQIEIRMLSIRQGLDIEKILTPEQKTKLRNSRMEMKRMGPPPPPPHDEMDE